MEQRIRGGRERGSRERGVNWAVDGSLGGVGLDASGYGGLQIWQLRYEKALLCHNANNFLKRPSDDIIQ